MIYLIGGPPRCGKSTTAKLLSQKLKVSCVSADTLESIVDAYTPARDYAKKFPKNIFRKRTKHSNDVMYERYTTQEIMRAYITQAKACWKAVEVFVECEIKTGNDIIIEGAQIHPALVQQLQNKFGSKNIKSVFVVKIDPQLIVEGAKKNNAKSDWFLQKTRNEITHIKVAKMIGAYGAWFGREAAKRGMDVVNSEVNFEKQIKYAAALLR